MARNKLLLRQITLLSKVPKFTPVFLFLCLFCVFLFLFKHIFNIAKITQKVNNTYSIFSRIFALFFIKILYFHVVFFTT